MSNLATINHHLGNKKDADNIYLNIRIQNNNISGSSVKAIYDVTKDIPLIENPSQYYISVIDFTIPINGISLFQAAVIPPPNTNYSLLQQSIVVVYGGMSQQVNLIMIPSATYLDEPTSYQPTNSYYNIYSFNAFINMFNTAIATAWTGLGVPGQPAFFYLNPATQLISLVVSQAFVGANGSIGINGASANYLQGFDFLIDEDPLYVDSHFAFVIYLTNNICNQYGGEIGIPGGEYIILTQNYPSLDMWSDIRKIFITTTSINIKALQVPVNLPNGTQTGQIYNAPILFDFTPQFINSASIRTITYYVPESQYRLVDILSDEPIKNINLSLFIENTTGVVFPLRVPIYQAINIKLGFFKKSLYKHFFPHSLQRTDH